MRSLIPPPLVSLIPTLLAIATASSSGETIYAVVFGNQRLLVGSSTLSSGLFRSTDDGRSWDHLGVPNLKSFSMDADDDERGRTLYVAAGNGVHRSTDGGVSWRVVTDWRVTEVLDVRVDPRLPATIWAATAWGLWRSDDRGEQWRFVPLEMQRRPGRRGMIYTYRLATVNGRLFALTDSAIVELPLRGKPRTVQRVNAPRAIASTRFGRAVAAQPFQCGRLRPAAPPSMNVYDMVVDESTIPPTLMAAGEHGIHALTLRADAVWSDVTGGLPTRVVHALTRTSRGSLLVGTWGDGIWRRDAGGGYWSRSGLEGCQVWRMVVKPW